MPDPATAPATAKRTALLGLLLAVVAVLIAAPARLVPWGAAVHAVPRQCAVAWGLGPFWQAVAGDGIPLAVCALLIIAARLLPVPAKGPRRPEFIPLAIGALLLLEPFLHLALLAGLSLQSWRGAEDLLLPRIASLDPLHQRLQVVVYLLAAPIAEEFFFRGRLVPYLAQRLDRTSAVTLSALAFACAHGDISQAIFALPLGLLLGTLRISGAGLLPCILAHMTHNALFLIAGPTLVSQPWIGLGLSLAGAAYLALAVVWPGGGIRLRIDLMCVAVLALVVAISAYQPWYGQAQDRWWLGAMHRIVVSSTVPDEVLLARLDAQCARMRIDQRRRRALARALVEEPAPSFDRQVWMVGRLDPDALVRSLATDESVQAALTSLASCPVRLPGLAEAARDLGYAHPGLFAALASEAPEVLQEWLPLPDDAAQVRLLLSGLSGWERQRLLSGLERAWPGQVAAVLLGLPAGQVTPIERRFLFSHDPDAQAHLSGLTPELQRAWSP